MIEGPTAAGEGFVGPVAEKWSRPVFLRCGGGIAGGPDSNEIAVTVL